MVVTSSHVCVSSSYGGEYPGEGYMALELFFVSARTNKRHHHRFNANAHGNREGYSRGNESHMKRVDDQFQACVAAVKGTLVSPRTLSWIDVSTGKGAKLDHLVGLGVEFTCTSGAAAWVGYPFQDHARVSFAVKIGTPRPMTKGAEKSR